MSDLTANEIVAAAASGMPLTGGVQPDLRCAAPA
jgi:hypothetical protein